MAEGRDLTMRLLRDAGFTKVESVATDGHPGIFATLDAGAARTVGLYFMYDVKQADPKEWSSPPWDAAMVDMPKLGKAVMGRGAVNQKGPQAAFLAALHAIRGAGKKLPVNLVLVAEGEEEIGSPHFPQIVSRPAVQAALKRCDGIFMPSAEQSSDGTVTITLGAKGVIELEIVASADTWKRGPRKDIHSSNRARVDSPAWHLVQALNTLVTRRSTGCSTRSGRSATGIAATSTTRRAGSTRTSPSRRSAWSAGRATRAGARRWRISPASPPSTSRAW
jgi:acetylornithine deacetylase/succinyl-diaminopimelate desuccinylase-like protein